MFHFRSISSLFSGFKRFLRLGWCATGDFRVATALVLGIGENGAQVLQAPILGKKNGAQFFL